MSRLDGELAAVKPAVLVWLGATAADDPPSAILRLRDDEDRHREMAAFVRDLSLVTTVLD